MNSNQKAELARHTINLLQLKASKIKTNKLIFHVEDEEVAREVVEVLQAETDGILFYQLDHKQQIFTVIKK